MTAITSAHRLRYEQAKHDHGLQCDSWILLKRFRFQVIAGSPWRPSWASLRTKALIVGYLDTCTNDLYCSTALVCVDTSRKSLSEKAHVLRHSDAHQTHLDLKCKPLILANTCIVCSNFWYLYTEQLTLQCAWHAEGYVKSVHYKRNDETHMWENAMNFLNMWMMFTVLYKISCLSCVWCWCRLDFSCSLTWVEHKGPQATYSYIILQPPAGGLVRIHVSDVLIMWSTLRIKYKCIQCTRLDTNFIIHSYVLGFTGQRGDMLSAAQTTRVRWNTYPCAEPRQFTIYICSI